MRLKTKIIKALTWLKPIKLAEILALNFGNIFASTLAVQNK